MLTEINILHFFQNKDCKSLHLHYKIKLFDSFNVKWFELTILYDRDTSDTSNLFDFTPCSYVLFKSLAYFLFNLIFLNFHYFSPTEKYLSVPAWKKVGLCVLGRDYFSCVPKGKNRISRDFLFLILSEIGKKRLKHRKKY